MIEEPIIIKLVGAPKLVFTAFFLVWRMSLKQVPVYESCSRCFRSGTHFLWTDLINDTMHRTKNNRGD